jgi:hypothetical protein
MKSTGKVALRDTALWPFVDSVYHERYSLISNNCIHKSVRIQRKARESGTAADLIACVSLVKMQWLGGLTVPSFHVYALIDGEKVDVSLDPWHEAKYCRNAEKRLLFPINLSAFRRRFSRQRPVSALQGPGNNNGL